MVADEPNPFYPEIEISQFKQHVIHLAENYHVLPLEEVANRIKQGKSLHRCVAITFDDGFLNNYTLAYPLLKQLHLPATIFLITDCIETGQPPWFIKFRYAFQTTRKEMIEVTCAGETLTLPLTTEENRLESSNIMMQDLRTRENDARKEMLESLFHLLEVDDFTALDGMMLHWEQIREMSRHGISFGAHTASHPVMSRISLPEAEHEVRVSMEVIQSHLGQKVATFAYPFGRINHYRPEIAAILQKCGITCAVTTEHAASNHASSLYELGRSFPWELCGV
ncbi:MAG: polysaccharide deacetylase family protein [Sedimentisphaerales bacterium]|nr:polysaccharide deacetylase family protein [Sedimentisphaerales bacterium]